MKLSAKKLEPYFVYLDKLRSSGVTNMYGAPRYLEESFGLEKNAAIEICKLWSSTFNHYTTPLQRAKKAKKTGG